MKAALLSALALAVMATVAPQFQSAYAQTIQLNKSTKPTIMLRRQQVAPQQAAPGTPGTQGARTPGVQLRTHCNGTCMCAGDDCTERWIADNCKNGEATCSNDPKGMICSCVRKAALR